MVEPAFTHIDPFGNQKRRYVDRDKMAETLLDVKNMEPVELAKVTAEARRFVEARTWERTAKQIEEAVKEISDSTSAKEGNG